MSELANESAVLDLYSQYKSSRDVIDLDIYLALRDSAREAIELKQHEHQIQQITKMAMNSRVADVGREKKAFSSASSEISSDASVFDLIGAFKSFRKKVADVARPSNLMSSPMRGMSMVAGAGVVALGLGLLGTGLFSSGFSSHSKSDYVAEIFIEKAHLVDQLIVGNQEWQYGFSASTGAAAKAFQAGELVVDLSVMAQRLTTDKSRLAGDISERSVATITQRLRAHAPYADESVDIAPLTRRTARRIESELADYYAKDEIQAQMFQFGQWVEYHYILSRLAVEDGRVAVYQNNYKQRAELLNKLEAQLRSQNLLSEDDIARMKAMSTQNLTLDNIEQISTLLLKVRSVLSYG